MKRSLTFAVLLAALLGAGQAFAQDDVSDKAARKAARKEAVKEEIKAHFKPYGFIRTYGFYNTRATKSLTEDLFFFIPLDKNSVDDVDVNAVGNFGYQAITTRIGLDIKDYKFGNTAIEAKIEADFYCLNSGGNIGTLRMRQAYARLMWEPSEKFSHSLLVGQSWHPIAADLVNSIALESGAPFDAFNRSAQLMYNANFGKHVTLTAGFIEQMQYRSNGPDGSTNKYQRYAILPEAYLGVSVKAGGFLGRVGCSALSIRPHYGYYSQTVTTPAQTATITDANDGSTYTIEVSPAKTVTTQTSQRYHEWLTTFNPFIFLQYTGKIWQIKAKAILAQSGEHMQLNGGYAATAGPDDGINYRYTPTQSLVSFFSGQVGKRYQFIGMVGYQKNLGLAGGKEMLDASRYYFSGNGFKNINQMMRVSPTFAFNLGKMQLALEYDYTMVQYGGNCDGKLTLGTDFNKNGTVTENLHWVGNHRILAMAKYSF